MPYKDKEQKKEADHRYRMKHGDHIRELQRQWRANNKGHKDAYYRQWRYGMSSEQYEELLKKQNGLCAICAEPPGPRGFHIDHDHVSNIVRGMLCQSCNLLLGHAKDSVKRLSSAISYLEENAIAKERPGC